MDMILNLAQGLEFQFPDMSWEEALCEATKIYWTELKVRSEG